MYLAAGVGLPMAVLAASPVALPHYRELWIPLVVLLVALGSARLIELGRDRATWIRPAGAMAGLLLAVLAVTGVRDSARLLADTPGDYHRASQLVTRRVGPAATVVVAGHADTAAQYLLRTTTVLSRLLRGHDVQALLVDRLWWDRYGSPAWLARFAQHRWRPEAVGRLQVWLPARPPTLRRAGS